MPAPIVGAGTLAVLPKGCRKGYSTNRPGEIGLTEQTGIPYRPIAYLLDECSS